MQPAISERTSVGAEHLHQWDFKHMVRLMVTAAAYRQIANPTPELKELDPNNRLLACQTPRRLEAEFVRDNALAISGLLNPDIGGPSAHPYQPAGYYANLQFPDRDYIADKDDQQYRRGIYTHWQRTFLHPMLANFDAPGREECVAARIVSNTPQQALTLLDDPSFVECSRVFAERLLGETAESDADRINRAFLTALARYPKQKETASLLHFLATQRQDYSAGTRAVSARSAAGTLASQTEAHKTPKLLKVKSSAVSGSGAQVPARSSLTESAASSQTDNAARLLAIGNAPAPKNIPPAELAAWTQVCRVILNLHESITIY
jgi:Protein of unknown function (DUF1553)